MNRMKRVLFLIALCLLAPPSIQAFDDDDPKAGSDGIAGELDSLKSRAEKGDVDAQKELGMRYRHALNGVFIKDDNEAFKWYLMAAEQGDPDAQHQVGYMLRQGEGIPQNYNEAFSWFLKSAKQGYSSSMREIGDAYFHGRGVAGDIAEAYVWYSMATAQSGWGMGNIGRDLTAEMLTPEALEAAQERAARLFEEIQKNKFNVTGDTP